LNYHSYKLLDKTLCAILRITSYSYIQLYRKAKTHILRFKKGEEKRLYFPHLFLKTFDRTGK